MGAVHARAGGCNPPLPYSFQCKSVPALPAATGFKDSCNRSSPVREPGNCNLLVLALHRSSANTVYCEGSDYMLYLVTMALVSFATLWFELLATRILSFIFWNHMVYLIVAVALLGFGVSGTLIAIRNVKNSSRRTSIVRLLVGFGLSVLGTTLLAGKLALFEMPSLCRIFACYGLFIFPFMFAGAIIARLLSTRAQAVGMLYGADLTAGALACASFAFVLPALGVQKIAGIIALSMGLLAISWSSARLRWESWGAAVTIAAGLLVTIFGSEQTLSFICEPYKELATSTRPSLSLHSPGLITVRGIEQTVWSPLCRVDVLNQPNMPYYSERYRPDTYKIITQDGTAHTRLLSAEARKQHVLNIRGKFPLSVEAPFVLRKNPDVAVIGVGGGIDVINALAWGSRSVIGAEVNPTIFDLTTKVYADYSGHALDDPRVKVVCQEGRSMIRQLDRQVDIINVVAIDTFAASSAGAYVLTENYLYTVEAIHDMLSKLKDDGILMFHRWNWLPPCESLRMCSLYCEELRRDGRSDIAGHIAVLLQGDWATCLLKKTVFTEDELARLAIFTQKNDCPMIFVPRVLSAAKQAEFEHNYYGSFSNDKRSTIDTNRRYFSELIGAYQNGKWREYFDRVPYRLDPTTDDSPFFFEYYAKNKYRTPDINALRGANSAHLTLLVVLCQCILFSAIAIIWPLWRYRRAGIHVPHAWSYAIYFGALGFGFMVLELSLVQKSVLLLGNPLYALSVVLASLMLGAGLGSFLQAHTRLSVWKTALAYGVPLLVLVCLIAFAYHQLMYSCLALPFFWRLTIVLTSLLPSGVLMGTFFPNGIAAVKRLSPGFVPWAWGINGCTSVLGSFAAIVISIVYGFTVAILLGAVSYLVAIAATAQFSHCTREMHQTGPDR